jgi:hypothetical protein
MNAIAARSRVLLMVFAILVVAVIVVVGVGHSQMRGRAVALSGPQVYLWQRSWSPAVKSALTGEAPAFSRVVVLAAQIDWAQDQPRTVRTGVDWGLLGTLGPGTEVAAAVRVSTFHGAAQELPTAAIVGAVTGVLSAAHAAGVRLAEIQLDVDAPTSQLPAYRSWLAAARGAAAPTPVTFTALPTWLNSPAFAGLARDAGSFVLQLHSLERPARLPDDGHPLTLCDLSAARAAIAKADRLGVPFRIALPTYSYLAAFNPDGSFAALSAENAPPGWGEGKTVHTVEADPVQLANFVHEISARPPNNLEAIIWYRLPVADDRLNWSWPTLRSVMAGRVPAAGRLEVSLVSSAPALYDIRLTNAGETAIDTAAAITLSWSGAAYVAADTLADASLLAHSDSSLALLAGSTSQSRLQPGQFRTIGWLRLSREAHVHAALHASQSDSAGNPGSNPGAGP